jgi:NAD(P)-dependent dehydrogenase (short-subunit alcohol dehydrogenase family)
MDLQLKDKIAVVTGGSSGIGLAAAHRLADEGARLVLCARGRERLEAAAAKIRTKYRCEVLAVATDIATPEGVELLIEAVAREFRGVDILIANAGEGSHETVMGASDVQWQYFWDLFLMSAVRLARGFVPLMRARGGGAILHNASICGKQPLFHQPIYDVTKAALMMFSKCLAHELIGENIRVNCVNPGLVRTPAWEESARKLVHGTGETIEEYFDKIARENTPIGRFATPDELAQFMVFLCSPAASYCVGSTYYVDGGWLRVVA